MGQKLWTREEEIIVFNLYCKIPFKSSSKTHPDVIRIANLIGRSPSAVNMKIGNFGSFDENLKKQGIHGLTNSSRLDKQIWEEFTGNWDQLAIESELLIAKFQQQKELQINAEIPKGDEKLTEVKRRINQDFFRNAVLASYESACCITGLNVREFLIASHIKPWRDSTSSEKTDPRNGLCLNALHDRAFDQGFITVLPNYKILISNRLKEVVENECLNKYFICFHQQQINLPEKFMPGKSFLEFHNDMIFKG